MIGLWGWITLANKVISDVVAGNGNGFTVKELMHAHIQDDKEFKFYVRDQFEKVHNRFETGTGKIGNNKNGVTKNTEGIKGLKRALIYGIGPLLFFVLGWLIKIQVKP